MSFEVTRQNKCWPRSSRVDHRYYIRNKILSDCIGIGSGTIGGPGRISGFNSSKGLGYALLTYFVSQALGFRRLPFYEDRIYSEYVKRSHSRLMENAQKLNHDDVLEIAEEVKLIYMHTQKKLKEASLSTVKLRREIAAEGSGYAETIMRLKDCADILGYETIEFEMDTLNSFGDEGAYKHLADVTIEHEFPARDVLYCSSLVGSLHQSDLVETGEWVIINRSPTGLVEFPLSSIKYDSESWGDKYQFSQESAERFISTYEPLEYRNLCFQEERYGTQGKFMKIRKRVSRWLMSNNRLT